MKKHITIFILLCYSLCAILTQAQKVYKWDIGTRFGASNYLGDIGGKDKTRRTFILDMKLKKTHFVVGGTARYKFNPKWALNTQLNYAQIRGDDALSTNEGRMWRNLRFKNNILELTARGEYTFMESPDVGGRGYYKLEFASFVHAGLTCFYHNPKGSLDGKTWHRLQPMKTEGVKYNKIGIGIPLGLGILFTYEREHRFGIEFNWTSTFTDYLDDISGNYAYDPDDQSSLTASLANQSEEVVPPNEINNYLIDQKRGDPSHDDAYIFTTFTYSYILQEKNKFYKGRKGMGKRRMRKNISRRRTIKSKF